VAKALTLTGVTGTSKTSLMAHSRRILRQPNFHFNKGFTLLEIIVVCVIIALAMGAAVIGYNIVSGQRLSSEMEKMNDWFEAVAETAVFQSSVLGVRGEEGILSVVAYYDGRWYLQNNIPPFQMSGEFQWDVETEENIELGQDFVGEEGDRAEEREPFVAFLPSGQAIPEGRLNLYGTDRDSGFLSWDSNAEFDFSFGEEDS